MNARTTITIVIASPIIIVTAITTALVVGISAGLRHALLAAVRVTKGVLRHIIEEGAN